ncbi:MAG: prolipoprotein diacylglyceryl transferase [Alphaproteobacteria bacterium]|nr:prolipoprotein diacylglyceryl transferase [Alphaproteobacteria bacterium]
MALQFPEISPFVFQIGGFGVRWYALAYLAGFILGWRYSLSLAAKDEEEGTASNSPTRTHIDDFLSWAIVGVLLGGRLGYVFFYQPSFFMANPLEIIKIWHGGMSFHGGALGVITAMILFSHFRKVSLFRLSDIICAAVPIGLFFGRLANFVNAELYGRVTTVPWGMIFPGQTLPRHPSQIYEALLEGLVLFGVLAILIRKPAFKDRPGFISGAFLFGYGMMRGLVEFVREPDSYLGLFAGWISMGQILCLPMILVGAALMVFVSRKGMVLSAPAKTNA